MKSRVVIAAIVLSASAAYAGTPPSLEPFTSNRAKYYSYDDQHKDWIFDTHTENCTPWIESATKAGVDDNLALDIPYDTPDWKAGKHTFAELKAYCTRVGKSSRVDALIGWIKLGAQGGSNAPVSCITSYEAAIREKTIEPSLKLPYEGMTFKDPSTGDPYAGTIEDARKKFCDANAKDFLADRAAKEAQDAPYRKVLKADKLEVFFSDPGAAFYGPGYKELTTPAAFAKATVWFRSYYTDDNTCKKGQESVWTVRRYQFDAKQKLVKDTSKDYCGKPSASAFK